MYELRFGEKPPQRRSIEQLRVSKVPVCAKPINYWPNVVSHEGGTTPDWDKSDLANRCFSAANACLYGITEAAVLAAGYAPAVGFIHTGSPFLLFMTLPTCLNLRVVPIAFQIAARQPSQPTEQFDLRVAIIS